MGGDDRDERVGRDGRSVDEKLAPHDFVADFVWAAREVLRKPSVAIVSIALWTIPAVLGVSAREQQSPQALGDLQRSEIERRWPLIKAAGIKGE